MVFDNALRTVVAATVVSLGLAGCQTNLQKLVTDSQQALASSESSAPAEQSQKRVSWDLYTPLYDQGDHLKTLVTEDKRFDDAATLYLEQKAFFTENRANQQVMVDTLAREINKPKLPALQNAIAKFSAIKWPAPVDQWAAVRDGLTTADEALAAYTSHDILREARFRAEEATQLEKSLSNLKDRIRNDAPTQFKAFNHFGATPFFDSYPVEIRRPAFMNTYFAAVEPTLANATTTQIKAFAANYPKETLGSDEQWARVGERFVAAAFRETSKGMAGDLVGVLNAINAAKAAGFEPTKVPGLKIAFVEVTSKTLLKQGQIDFAASVDVDLPIESVKAELDDALTNPTVKTAEFLIVFDVALAKASRRVLNLSPVPSILVAGYKTVPNSQYNIAQNEVNNAQLQVQRAAMSSASTNAQYCYGIGCLGKAIGQIAAAAAESQASDALRAAMANLSATPQFVEEPIHQEYKFDKATIVARKAMTVHYYVIDETKKIYFKSSFDVNEEKRFNVAYRISDKDTKKNDRLKEFDTEKDVDEFEKAAPSVKLTQLIDHYLANKGKSRPYTHLAALRQEMLTDKNKALANFKANTYDSRPLNDPRFDSVVVVYTGGGSLGSGVFVKPDVVLTNWHVVEEFKFVEMKTYDGQETFGKVLGKDVRLDLALIKVQSRGKPVRFYTKNTVDLGATVDAIGHPHRKEFSITRGIVSAIRKHFSINMPKGAGDQVLYVQTDAPINKGNSGGPLFLGDHVIGINTFGVSKDVAEGVNFSVHYSEVLDFLKEHLPGFVVLQ